MNRVEIKFRAFHHPSKRMYWFDLMWGNKATIGGGYIAMLHIGEEREYGNSENRIAVNPDDCHILQCSGVPDKNGKDIYEGDIVKGLSDDCYYEVEFFNGIFGTRIGALCTLELEVIGNKYENPELCEKNIDLSDEAVKAITIQAINENTVFKLKAEQILEDYAKPFMALKKPKSAVAKSKK